MSELPTVIVNNEQKPISSNKRNHRCCSVPNCKSANYENLTFHVFPKEGTSKAVIEMSGEQVLMDRRKAWGVKTFLGKEFGKDVRDSTYVCSRHFLPSDYRPQNLDDNSGKMKMRCLKKAAVPTQNLPLRAPSPVEKKPKKKKKSKPKPKPVENVTHDSATPSTSSSSDMASCSMSIPDMLDTCDTSMINDALLSSLLESIPDLPTLTNLEQHSVETVIPVHRESRTLLEMLEAGEDIMEAHKSWGIDAGPIFDDHLNMS